MQRLNPGITNKKMVTISELAEKLQDDVKTILNRGNFKPYTDHSKWTLHPLSKDLYVRGIERKSLEDADLSDEISKLQSYKDLVDALSLDEIYSKRLDKIITIHSQSSSINAEAYIKSVLVNVNDLLLKKPYQAKRARAEFLKELTADEYTVRLVTPILGLKVAGRIPLELGSELIPQNDSDVVKCLDWGLLPTPFANDGTYWVSPMHAGISFLISEFRHPIISGRRLNEKEVKAYRVFNDKHEWLKDSLQMMFDIHSHKVNIGKTIVTGDYLAIPGESISNPEVTPEVWEFGKGLVLKRSLGDNRKTIFRLLHDPAIKSNRMLRLSCSRLALARHRKSDEDSFLDLMIACEAFYMSNESDHLDIGYKLRIRAAMWYSGGDYSKRDIMKLFTLAYGVRSRIAHGSELDKIKFKGEELAIRNLFEIVEKILKVGLLKYFRLLDTKPASYVHDWENVVTGK